MYTVSFKTTQSIFCFSKWRLLIFSGDNHPQYPPSLTAYLTPEGGTPDFSSKWPQRMYFRLTRWLSSLSFWFWGDREKLSRGWYPPPLIKSGLSYIVCCLLNVVWKFSLKNNFLSIRANPWSVTWHFWLLNITYFILIT